jgi:hypothetical protein
LATPAASSDQVSWWLPALYTTFGACLGFILARLQSWLEKRETRKSFLKGVRAELTTIHEHLKGTLKNATEYKELFDKGARSLLYLPTEFQRGIFDSQVGKLKTVADPLVIEIIQFYDKVSNLEKVKAHFTSVAFDLTGLPTEPKENDQTAPLVAKYYSALNEIIKRINELLPIVSGLLAKLQSIG